MSDSGAVASPQKMPAKNWLEWIERLIEWPRAEPVKLVTVVLASIVAFAGCAFYYLACAKHPIPSPPSSFDGSSLAAQGYCASLADTSAQLAVTHFYFGWAITIAVLLAAAWSLTKIKDVGTRMIWVACVSAIALLGRSVLQRADAASELSVAAITARTLEHALDGNATSDVSQVVFSTCSRAWSAWVKSRTDSSAIARSALEETVSALKQSADKTTSNAKAEAQAAQQTTQTLAGDAAKTQELVKAQTQELNAVVDDLKKAPAHAEAAAKIADISSAIQASVADAASNAASVAQGAANYVLQVGTDQSQSQGCATLTNMKAPNIALPLARVYVNAAKNRWMTVAGPTTKEDADSIKKKEGSKIRQDSAVLVLPTDWSIERCGAN
jgi:hypothetical protein